VTGAPKLLAADGTRLAGDADYGPLRGDGPARRARTSTTTSG